MSKNLLIKIYNENTEGLQTGDFGEITLDDKLTARIKTLAAAARALGVDKVVDQDCSCILRTVDYDDDLIDGKEPLEEQPVRTDCDRLNVTQDSFFWSGFYNGVADARWSTAQVPLASLDLEDDVDQRASEDIAVAPDFEMPSGWFLKGLRLTADQITVPGYYWWLPLCSADDADKPEHWKVVAWHPKDTSRQKSGLFVGPIPHPINAN